MVCHGRSGTVVAGRMPLKAMICSRCWQQPAPSHHKLGSTGTDVNSNSTISNAVLDAGEIVPRKLQVNGDEYDEY